VRLLVMTSLAGVAQNVASESLLGGLKHGAAKAAGKLGETTEAAAGALGVVTDKAVDKVNETVESAERDLLDEATPEQTKAKLDAMAEETLGRLFEAQPGARDLFDLSAGYAAFATRQLDMGVTAGYGRGVAIDLATGARTYMRAGSAGVGVSFGYGGFDTRIVILFEDAEALRRFVTEGLDASAEAGTILGDDNRRLALHFEDGRAVFMLTKTGWKVSAKLAGTRYWPDDGLN
jgi:hypothetical protein